MPELRLPENYLPSDDDLISIVRRRPNISLREICDEVWPDLPWSGTESATVRVWEWQIPPRPGVPGNRVQRATAAHWLRDRMEVQVMLGAARYAPRRRDECDPLASLSYFIPSDGAIRGHA